MAMAIRAVRDGVLLRLTADPGVDLGAYADELGTIFELATRA
jgi:hypothetical protein